MDTVIIHKESVTLIKRKNPPYKGSWALPGGFVEYGETVESAAIRETKEETGLDVILGDIVGVYSNPDRDPEGAYYFHMFFGSKNRWKAYCRYRCC